jgi:hypothetical protein
MKPLYQVLQIDLTVQRDGVELLGQGVEFDGVTVHQLPAVGAASLGFGSNSQSAMIPLVRTEPFRFLDSCEHPFFCTEGLFITNPAGAGVLILIVSLGTEPRTQK